MRLFAASILLSALVATPAFAQDNPDKAFEGVKVIALGGIDRINADNEGATGFTYGGTIGYDHQAGRWIYGVEAEYADSTANRCDSNVLVAGDRVCRSAGRDLYAGVRAGYAVGDSALLYVKGGYTNTEVFETYFVGPNGIGAEENRDGWRVGTGVELNLTKRIVARAEYRYSNYETRITRHQGLIGLGVRF